MGRHIVTATNHSLLGGGDVDDPVHHEFGPELKQACRALREMQ